MDAKKKSIIESERAQPKKRSLSHAPLNPTDPTRIDYFKDIVGTIREPLVVLDAGLRVLSANRSFYRFFKVKAGETIGALIYELGNRQWDIPALRLLLETILPQKAVFNDFEVEHDFPTLGRRVLLLNARRIPGPPKAGQWILLAFEDISERRRLEQALQASEERFRRAFETAHDGMLLIEKTGGRVLNSNQSAQDLLGYSNQTFQKKKLWELGILKDEQQFRQASLELEKQGIVGLPEVTIPTRQGGHFPADVYLMDRAAVIQCNIRDIRERKQEEIQKNEKRFQALVEHSMEEISLVDSDGTLTWESPNLYRPLGYPPNSIVGHNIFEIFHPDERAAAARLLKKVGEHPGSAQEATFRLRHQDGSWRWMEGFLTNLLDEPAIQSLVINYRDVTERKQAEEKLKYQASLLENVTDAIVASDDQFRLTAWNAAAESMYGWKAEEVIGKYGLDITQTQYPETDKVSMLEAIAKAGFYRGLATQVRKDGRRFPVEISSVVLRDHNGQVIGYVSVNHDITERKQAEEALSKTEQIYRQAITRAGGVPYQLDYGSGSYVFLGEGFESLTGYHPSELTGPFFTSRLRKIESFGEHIELSHEQRVRLARRGGIDEWREDYLFERKDGTLVWLADHSVQIKDAVGNPIGSLGILMDITERKRAEEKSAKEQIILRTLIDNLPDTIFVKDADSRIIMDNMAHRRLLGAASLEQVVGKTDFDFFPKKLAASYMADEKQVIQSGESLIDREEPVVDQEQNQRWLLTTKVPLRDAQGKVTGIVGINHDITGRKQAEAALAKERSLLSALTDNIPDGIYFKDKESRFLLINHAQAHRFGLSDPAQAIGKTDFDFFTEEHARPACENEQAIIQSGQPVVAEEEKETWPDGRVGWVSTTKMPLRDEKGNIVGTFGISRDITERKQAEEKLKAYSDHLEEMVTERTRELRQAQEQLVRKEKLAMLGQLAGSVGHELRNPLSVINTSIYYLKLAQPEAGGKIKEHHAMIEQEVHNADKIITDLLDFARGVTAEREPVSVPGVVQKVLERFPAPPSVQVTLKIPADLPMVFADPRQVQQVLGNIIINACQAMVSQTGTLSINSTMGVSDRGKVTISARLEKDMLAIAVKDAGTGISPENMKKLFEPLFTTKAKGIGLGLAVSKKLAEANSGRIEVESAPGKGSTFTLFLPVVSA